MKVSGDCQDMMQKYIIFDNTAMKVRHYRINFWFMTKSKPVKRMKNVHLGKNVDNYYYKKKSIFNRNAE